MEAIQDPIGEQRQRALTLLRRAQTHLIGHGFRVELEGKFWALSITHEADKLAPARTLRVQLAAGSTERLQWWWVRDAIEDVEFLAEGIEIDRVIERIAHELRPAAHR